MTQRAGPVASVLLVGALTLGCSAAEMPGASDTSPADTASSGPSPSAPLSVEPSEPSASERSERPVRPVTATDFDQRRAMEVVEHLAGTIGPRHATSPAYADAARWVGERFDDLGYRVSRESFDVPGGESWGVPVPPGRAVNVVATPRGFDPTRPHLVVGAHLDTVPQAPGAEDNASGVGVLLAAAAAAQDRATRLPVVWIAFGAEEPRGPTDDDHHYGSQHHVSTYGPARRAAMRAMVSLDRVGVGATMPVGSAGPSDPVQRSLLAAAGRSDTAALAVAESRSSDHWSFVRDGLPAARLGSTSYAAYHSAADLPEVVDPAQLGRAGRILLAWLAPPPR
jgi:aminopeptidase YwaD